MRSLALPIAAAALLAVAAVAALQVLRPAERTASEQAATIAAELRCPDCQALSVAESRTAAAAAIRAEIADQLAAGRNAAEIRRHFVERYGEWILLSPTDPLAWWLPAAALLAAVVAFGWWWLRRRRPVAGATQAAVTISDADRRRVRDAAEALDD